ncbi:hypothetical protein DFJ74DRAFT_121316 [Hyaloraphidium curvatum]|nr:hypothetical protein DFJ74DRAFT_121316 [Hyaloraphidium curvatum]
MDATNLFSKPLGEYLTAAFVAAGMKTERAGEVAREVAAALPGTSTALDLWTLALDNAAWKQIPFKSKVLGFVLTRVAATTAEDARTAKIPAQELAKMAVDKYIGLRVLLSSSDKEAVCPLLSDLQDTAVLAEIPVNDLLGEFPENGNAVAQIFAALRRDGLLDKSNDNSSASANAMERDDQELEPAVGPMGAQFSGQTPKDSSSPSAHRGYVDEGPNESDDEAMELDAGSVSNHRGNRPGSAPPVRRSSTVEARQVNNEADQVAMTVQELETKINAVSAKRDKKITLGDLEAVSGVFSFDPAPPAELLQTVADILGRAWQHRGTPLARRTLKKLLNLLKDARADHTLTVRLLEAAASMCHRCAPNGAEVAIQEGVMSHVAGSLLDSYVSGGNHAGTLAALRFLDAVTTDHDCAKQFARLPAFGLLARAVAADDGSGRFRFCVAGIVAGTASRMRKAYPQLMDGWIADGAAQVVLDCLVWAAANKDVELAHAVASRSVEALADGLAASRPVAKEAFWTIKDQLVDTLARAEAVFEEARWEHGINKLLDRVEEPLEDYEQRLDSIRIELGKGPVKKPNVNQAGERDGLGTASAGSADDAFADEPVTYGHDRPVQGRIFFSPLSRWYPKDTCGAPEMDVSQFYVQSRVISDGPTSDGTWGCKYAAFLNLDPVFEDDAEDSLVVQPENTQWIRPEDEDVAWDTIPPGALLVSCEEFRDAVEKQAWPKVYSKRLEKLESLRASGSRPQGTRKRRRSQSNDGSGPSWAD